MRILLATLFCMSFLLQAGEWRFNVPPSVINDKVVNADWRMYKAVKLDVEVLTPVPKGTVLCSFFIENKQNWWFESRAKLDLSQRKQTFVLSLDEGSTDWESNDLRRSFGPDALRWVRRWGIKVFSRGAHDIKVRIGSLVLVTRRHSQLAISHVTLPKKGSTHMLSPIQFRLAGFYGDIYDKAAFDVAVLINNERVPAFFKQRYTSYRKPWSETTSYLPLDLPVWQASWIPRKTGTYAVETVVTMGEKTKRFALGKVEVKEGADPKTSEVTEKSQFLHEYEGPTIYQHDQDDWQYPLSGMTFDSYIHAQLDWTTKWGNYTGLGEFDQELAWRLDQDLEKAITSQPTPILVFSEDELDDRGTFNWKDHPLNEMNQGTLNRPADFFRDPYAKRVILNRARYLWSRYGGSGQTSGLLFLVNRPQAQAVKWLNEIADTLQKEFPDAKVFANNPGLPQRSRVVPLDLFEGWQTDPRLARFTFVRRRMGRKEVIVEGRYPDPAAIVHKAPTLHWSGAEVFAIDIHNSEAAGNEVKVMCFLRTERGVTYQTKLLWLREDDWNRLYFPLNKPDFWTCLNDTRRRLQPWELLNIREVALRFFCDEPNEVILTVSNPHLLYPTRSEVERVGPLAITARGTPQETVNCYEKFEVGFDVNRTFLNPYDPREVDIMIEVTNPDGKRVKHPAYFHEPWELHMIKGRETPVRKGGPFWRARVAPVMPGKHRWRLIAKTSEGTAHLEGTFDVKRGNSKGFIRISPRDPKFFEFSGDGSFYYPIGHNLRSPSDRRPNIYRGKSLANADKADSLGTRMYDQWFRKMRASGENFTRIWMCPWWLGLEWNKDAPGYHGLGYYNQENAARLDRTLELAEKYNVYLNLETANHGMLSTSIDGDWEHSPYSKTKPGGFLKYATDFVYSKEAKRLHNQKLRYTIARWGYSNAIAIWGILTETEWTEPYFRGLNWVRESNAQRHPHIPRPYPTPQHQEAMRVWLSEAGGYLKNFDSHPHIVSTHFSNPQNGMEVWSRPNIEVVHNNAYTSFGRYLRKGRSGNGVADIIQAYEKNFVQFTNKPLIIGEWGGHPTKNTESQLTAELHVGIWANYMTRAAGVTGYWWWNLLDGHNLYPHFKAVAAFANGEDRRGKAHQSGYVPVIFDSPQASRWARKALALYNESELFAYIFPRQINRPKNSMFADSADDTRFAPSGKGKLALPADIKAGTYRIEYWNTYTGKMISSAVCTVTNSQRLIPIINHRVDLAIKLKRHRPNHPGN